MAGKLISMVEDVDIRVPSIEASTTTDDIAATDSVIDMTGYDSVLWLVYVGNQATTGLVKAYRGTSSAACDGLIAHDQVKYEATDDGQIFYVNVMDVGEQYCGVLVDKNGAAQTTCIAIKYNNHKGSISTTLDVTDEITGVTIYPASE